MGKERKEFVVHLCAPQEPGRCEETGAALHCGKRAKTGRGPRPEIAEAGPALFGPMDGERLGAQVAALADELDLDPPARPMEPRSFNAPRSPQLGSRDGDATSRGEVRERRAWRVEVEGYVSVARVLDSSGSVPGPSTHGGITRKIGRGAGATRTEAPGPETVAPSVGRERVLDSTADTLVTAELDSRRRKCHTGSPEDMGKRNRGERGRESKKKGRSSSSGQTVESCSSDEVLGREDESKVRRTAATKPGALLHSGLVMMQRHLGRQVEDCEAVDAVQAKGLAAAYLGRVQATF